MGGLGYGWFLNSSIGRVMTLTLKYLLFERELALLVALQGESIRKGGGMGIQLNKALDWIYNIHILYRVQST